MSPNGGLVRCKYCNAQSDVVARGKLEAFVPPPVTPISEAERIARLRSQVGKLFRPPPGIAPVVSPTGDILSHR